MEDMPRVSQYIGKYWNIEQEQWAIIFFISGPCLVSVEFS